MSVQTKDFVESAAEAIAGAMASTVSTVARAVSPAKSTRHGSHERAPSPIEKPSSGVAKGSFPGKSIAKYAKPSVDEDDDDNAATGKELLAQIKERVAMTAQLFPNRKDNFGRAERMNQQKVKAVTKKDKDAKMKPGPKSVIKPTAKATKATKNANAERPAASTSTKATKAANRPTTKTIEKKILADAVGPELEKKRRAPPKDRSASGSALAKTTTKSKSPAKPKRKATVTTGAATAAKRKYEDNGNSVKDGSQDKSTKKAKPDLKKGKTSPDKK